MKMLFHLILLFISTELLAQDLRIKNLSADSFNKFVIAVRTSNGIFLKGQDCNILKTEAQAISSWANKSDQMESVDCECTGSSCLLDLDSISPEILKNNQSFSMHSDGPNCWNASLSSAGLADSLRYSTPEEMNFWMESPLCKERLAGEAPEPGDVIAIRNVQSETKEVHGFTYLSENLSFSKNGYRKGSPYSLQDPKSVYSTYGVPEKCVGLHGPPQESLKGCDSYSNIFKCTSLNEYIKNKPVADEQKEILEGMREFECDMSQYIGSSDIIPLNVGELMIMTMSAVEKLGQERETEVTDPDLKFIWKIIEIRARAIKQQIPYL